MGTVKTVCMTASQSERFLNVSATVGEHMEERRYHFRLLWDFEPTGRLDVTMDQWLYNLLCRMVEEFDSFEMSDIMVEGVEFMREEAGDA